MATPISSANERHLPFLDWLRFIASLFVVFCHARLDHWVAWRELHTDALRYLDASFLLLIQVGPKPVLLFFVLSGYLVGGSVIRKIQKGSFDLGDYLGARLSRIYTPLLPTLILTGICVWYLHNGIPSHFWPQLLGNSLQMQGILTPVLEGNASLWTLSYEMWFYMFAGACGVLFSAKLAVMKDGRRRFIAAATLAIFSIWCLLVLDTAYFICWIMGALANVLLVKKFSRTTPFVVGALFCAGLAAMYLPAKNMSMNLSFLGIILVGASMALLIGSLSGHSLRPSRFTRLGTWLASFSYTLYLTHFPLLLVMRTWRTPYTEINAESLLFYFAKVLLCMVVAWLLYLPFERHTGAIRRYLTGKFREAN